jgi:uncharacterized membrane protein (TIGR02234 family)
VPPAADPAGPPGVRRDGRRVKYLILLGVLAAAALLLVAANAPWLTVSLRETGQDLEVRGADAAPALNGIALACAATVAAASIAARPVRYLLAAVLAALGAGAALSPLPALASPDSAAGTAVAAATGITGSVPDLVSRIAVSAWPAVAVVAGALVLLLAAAITVTARSWPGTGRRYAADPGAADVRGANPAGPDSRNADGAAAGPAEDSSRATDPGSAPADTRGARAADAWDALSAGSDPTAAGGGADDAHD